MDTDLQLLKQFVMHHSGDAARIIEQLKTRALISFD